MTKYISIGKFGKTHGVKGWIRVYSEADDPCVLVESSPWYQKYPSEFKPIDVDDRRVLPQYLLVHIRSIDTPEEAKQLTNQRIYINRDQLPKLKAGEYYWDDLIGFAVINLQYIHLGVVDEIMQTGANEVLILKGEKRRLIPFVKDRVIKTVDLNDKVIKVDWVPED